MRIRNLFAVLLLMLVAFSTSMLSAQNMAIPVDPEVRVGKLDCGLTYYIRHNNYPENRVNFYIAQRVGSIQEEESQRGLAHFLEHMAFNGSEHFNGEGKGIIDYTRSLGVNFGGDLNAYTSIAETVYNINDVPSTRQSAIDSCLLILKDWSGGLLLTDEEIDKERGVIHEEWRLRRSAQQRMLENQLEALYPGSKYGRRMPIGLMEIVDNFPYQELRDYYHKWYRPDNQALVIVGDVDVDHIEAQIKELFKDCVLDPNAAQVVDVPVPANDKPIIVIDKDKEQQYSEVTVMFKHDAVSREEKVNMDYMMLGYLESMVTRMLNTRLNDLAQEPDCPFDRAYCYDMSYLGIAKTMDAFTMEAMPKEGQSEAAAQALIVEALRAAQHGFTESEYERARDEYMSWMDNWYNERDKVSNETYGRTYCSNYLDGEPMTSVEQDYQIAGMIAPNMTVDMVNMIIPELINTDGQNMVITDFNQEKEGAVYPTVEGFQAAIDAANSAEIAPYVDNVRNEPLMDMNKLPKKGKIVKESENELFGYKMLELSNGARVVLKKTDFKQDEITMSAFQRGGQSLYGEKDWANLELISSLDSYTGLGNFSNSELQKALSGKQVSAYINVGTHTDGVGGRSTVKDLETMFQLVYLKFTALTPDEKKFNQTMNLMETQLKNKDLMPESAMSDSLQYIMSNRSWRNKPFNVDDLKQVSLPRIMEIAKERTANAANYTFLFVGNIDEATIRPLIEQYIASLPAQKGKKSDWVNTTDMPTGEVLCHFNRKMEEPKEYQVIIWHADNIPYSLENSIKANILGEVLNRVYLQKIREDAGAAYSTQAMGSTGPGVAGGKPRTMVLAVAPVNPEFEEMVLKVLNEEMANACTTIDATALAEAKENMLKDHATNLKENWYWRSNIQQYLLLGLDDMTGYEDIVKAQTPESIAEFARQIYSAGNKIELVMGPEQ